MKPIYRAQTLKQTPHPRPIQFNHKQSSMTEWPDKTREFHNHYFDSTIWNDFKFRDDDIIIATYTKSGTTWMQQIVSQLLFNGAENLNVQKGVPIIPMICRRPIFD